MFETTVVRARTAGRGIRFLTLSIAFHTTAVAAIIAASLASTRLPIEAPKQMMPIFFAPPVSLPPAIGTPQPAQPRPHVAPAPAPRTAVAPAAVTAPSTIPDTVAPVAAAAGAGSDGPPSSEVGVPAGIPGGIPGATSTGMPAPDAAGPLPAGGDVKAPITIRRVEPVYPAIAVHAHLSGTVVLLCVIDKSGHVRDARVVSSTFGAFAQPAIDAVQQWLFAPGTLHGTAVDNIFELTVRFQVSR